MIAHAEANYSLQDQLLPEVHQALREIGEVIEKISTALNLVTMNLAGGDGGRNLYHSTTVRKGASRLIHFLRDGLEAHEKQVAANRQERENMRP